jgi:hypothetical protein
MSTLFQKFPGLQNVQQKVKVYPVAVKFTAPLLAGRFEWNKVLKFAFIGNSGERFILDGVNLSATIDQLNFSNAIDPAVNNGFMLLDIIRDGNNKTVTLAPFAFSAFNEGAEFSADFSPTATVNNQENFSFQLRGALIQTPGIIDLGVDEITILLTGNIYRIKEGVLK